MKSRFPVMLAFLFIMLVFFSVFAPRVLAQNNPPVADAGPDQSIYVGEFAILEGSATDADGDAIVAWQWTVETSPAGSSPYFSDSGNPESSFTADVAGDYVLSLVVSDGIDWSLPDYVTIYMLEILPPVAIATADVTSGPAPLTVNFDGSQSYDPQGGTLTYDWTFGDGDVSTEVSPTHVYQIPGTYTAVLTVFDSVGQSALDTITITVWYIKANFTESAETVPVGTPIEFDPSSSYGYSTLVLYEFDFDGDGTYDYSSSTPDPVSYTYTAPGTYTVVLRVTDERGNTDTATATKTITPVEGIPEFPFGTVLLTSLALCAYLAAARWRRKQIT